MEDERNWEAGHGKVSAMACGFREMRQPRQNKRPRMEEAQTIVRKDDESVRTKAKIVSVFFWCTLTKEVEDQGWCLVWEGSRGPLE